MLTDPVFILNSNKNISNAFPIIYVMLILHSEFIWNVFSFRRQLTTSLQKYFHFCFPVVLYGNSKNLCNSVWFYAKFKVSVQSISFNLNDFYNIFFNTFLWLLEKVQELEAQMEVILAIAKPLLHTIKLGKLYIFS